MIKEVYKGIQELVLQANAGIKWFDWFTGQYLDDSTDGYEVPAVFVEFEPVLFEAVTNQVQKASLNFRLHLVTPRTRHTRAGMAKQDQALQHLEMAQKIYLALQGKGYMKPATEQEPTIRIFNSCSRTEFIPDHALSELHVIIQGFKTVAFDYEAAPVTIKARPKQRIIQA